MWGIAQVSGKAAWHLFSCFFQCRGPSSQPPRQVKGEGVNTCRGIALCGRRGCRYAASARCGKALNGAFRWRGCDILLHTVVLHFLSVLIPALFQSQAISACWRAQCRVTCFPRERHTRVTAGLVAMGDPSFGPTKHELSQLQGTGCALGQVPGSLLSPGDSVLCLCKLSSRHSVPSGISQGVMPTGDET